MTEKIVTINGINICCDISVSGTPLLMIHGVTDCKETFDKDLEVLTKYFTIIRYGLRCHGKSTHPESDYTSNDHISDALALGRL